VEVTSRDEGAGVADVTQGGGGEHDSEPLRDCQEQVSWVGPSSFANAGEAVSGPFEQGEPAVVRREARGLGEDDERLLLQVGRSEHAALGQWMVGREEGDQPLARKERLLLEPFFLTVVVEDADVEPTGTEPRRLLARGHVRDLRPVGRGMLVERLEEGEQTLDGQVRDAADPECVAGAARAPGRADCELHVGQHPPCLLGEDAPRVGQLHDAARPLEELDPERRLELSNRLREGRLRDVELLGRSPEVQLVAHRQEVAQVPELDREAGSRLLVRTSFCARSTHAAPNSAPSAGLTAASCCIPEGSA
jgi:hypothetical protein